MHNSGKNSYTVTMHSDDELGNRPTIEMMFLRGFTHFTYILCFIYGSADPTCRLGLGHGKLHISVRIATHSCINLLA
jgi:hypothetical protein